ncbi:MAG: hypothetical protein JW724_01985 [Candidatus Altiarchaeota archaeon]|nr:hypothetical protein [Candidatus Altiarchaeota archaeon]
MHGKRFSNQTVEQVLAHLGNLLDRSLKYNLSSDPLGVHYTVTESVDRTKNSEKRFKRREALRGLSRGARKHMGTKKMTGPKIRSIKKGRTVSLKGRTY